MKRAGLALGLARQVAAPARGAIHDRDERLEKWRDNIVAGLGEQEAARLMAEGAELDLDDGLNRILAWLRD